MRDGVRLATDVYLPAEGTAPGPAVLTRLPYDKTGEYTFMPRVAAWFTARGYRMVVQDVRGKFRSEGETLLFVNETYDGYDTIEWITHQEWSDGVVGMWGDSYDGYTQWAAASSAHRALKAMVPRVTGTRLGELPVPEAGRRTHDVEMSIHRFYPLSMFHDRDILEWELDWSRRPLAAAVEEFFAAVGSRSASYDLSFPHPVRLRRFPAGSPFDAPAVPVLLTIGWWDNCAPWQWADFRSIQSRPVWERNTYLLLEAIDHENNSHFAPDGPRDEVWMERYLEPAAAFFDVFLRGRAAIIPRVRWQHANSGDAGFREADCWPPSGVREWSWFPHGNGALLTTPSAGGSVSWTHDAADPLPSPVRDPFSFLAESPDEVSVTVPHPSSYDGPRRAAVVVDPCGWGVSSAVAAAVRAAASALSAAGWEVEEVSPPAVDRCATLWRQLSATEMASALLTPGVFPGPLSAGTVQYFTDNVAGVELLDTAAAYGGAWAERHALAAQWRQFHSRYPVVLGPVTTEAMPPIGFDLSGPEAVTEQWRQHRLLVTANFLGLPAVAVPAGGIPGGRKGFR